MSLVSQANRERIERPTLRAAAATSKACESSGRSFEVDGTVARCVNAPGSAANAEIRLQYSLGTPSEIAVIYHAPRAGSSEQYRSLFASLRGFYGEPQGATPSRSAACTASLEGCLAGGEHPGGAVWRWPTGSIEMVPVWSGEQALIELRYTRED